jgi:hypothetical protein
MRGSTRVLVLLLCLAFFILAYLTLREQRVPTAQIEPTEDMLKPTIDVTAAYLNDVPFPVESETPTDPSVGEYVGWTTTDIADDIVSKLEYDHIADAPTVVVTAVDVWSSSAQSISDPAAIAYGGDPDVAIVLSGTFHNQMPFAPEFSGTLPYMLLLVDRISGSINAMDRSDDLASLLAKLPPPP